MDSEFRRLMRGLRATAAAFPLPAGFQVHLPPLPLPLIREQHHPTTLAPTCPWCTAAQMRMTSCAHASSGLEGALSLQGAAGRVVGGRGRGTVMGEAREAGWQRDQRRSQPSTRCSCSAALHNAMQRVVQHKPLQCDTQPPAAARQCSPQASAPSTHLMTEAVRPAAEEPLPEV